MVCSRFGMHDWIPPMASKDPQRNDRRWRFKSQSRTASKSPIIGNTSHTLVMLQCKQRLSAYASCGTPSHTEMANLF